MIYSFGETVRVTVNHGTAGVAKSAFTITLLEDGIASSLTVNMTEMTNLGVGIYQFSFTPPVSTTKKKYYLRVLLAGLIDTAWDVTAEPLVAGQSLAIEINAGTAGLTLLQKTARDGNTDMGAMWVITELTAAGVGIYRAVATLPDSSTPYTLHARFYLADLSVDSMFDAVVQPSTNNLLTLNSALRIALNNPDISELSDAQFSDCWQNAVDAFSQYYPKEVLDYSIQTILDQREYDLPAETIDIIACRVYSTVADVKTNFKYFKQYQESTPFYTGLGNFKWEFKNNQLILNDFPTATDTGKYIGVYLRKSHVFINNACTTIPRSVMDGPIMDWAKGDAMEMWAGYQGTLRQGSASEDREVIRTEGRRLKSEAEKSWAVGLI
jgi:hypothetical protein